jgi:hypothetical protein
LRGEKRRSNPLFLRGAMDCFASLAMTGLRLPSARTNRRISVEGNVYGTQSAIEKRNERET